MMLFWIIVAAMMLAAVAILAPALLRNRSGDELDRDQQNVVIARERLAELESERDSGALTGDQYRQAKEELEQALLQDLEQQESAAQAQGAAERRLSLIGLGAIVVLVPLIGIGLYSRLGSPELALPPDQRATAHQGAGSGQTMSLEQMVTALVGRLKDNPDDAEGWFLLGRTYMAMKKFDKAAATFERLQQMVGDEPVVLLAWADAQAMSQQGDLSGRPAELIRKAVSVAPDDPTALWLAGMVEEQAGDHELALTYWERLAPMVQDDPESKQRVDSLIAMARKKAGLPPKSTAATPAKVAAAAGPGIRVRVALAPELAAKAEPEESLFIYAKALKGPRMPLAAARMKVKDLPVELTLDDSSAMMPQMKLSNFDQVLVGARVSRSGNAITASGDLKGEVSPVPVGRDGVVEILIDQVVP
ncbi:MAG TPA: c-type cytochrome biogenesis protein CcmI [Sedimenticola thiotaurini]|uniref:C-type cytochrome biogenesis protein CcmI n=1 Tax=Sedimenticola thiotaurini TaxID=1543721 RepID=A0A831RMC0_9GAMM|nr:c-type cytochrome biogenesis protein CcmI [Sedimenticola thiotaurini]